MKKLSVMLIVLFAIIYSLGVIPAYAAELEDVSVLETGTYRVSVTDPNKEDMGFFRAEKDGDLKDFVIIAGESYGYIYFDSSYQNLTYNFRNIDLELVSKEDLGVSGYHVFDFSGQRDYDPVIDGEYTPVSVVGVIEDFD